MKAPPEVGPLSSITMPRVMERKLSSGLRVIAVRRPSVPRLEVRLRIPAGLSYDARAGIRAELVGKTILAGTHQRSSLQIARDLKRLGASLFTFATDDDLTFWGGCLAPNLTPFFELIAEVLTRPTFPADEVAVAADKYAQEIEFILSQPEGAARTAFNARLYRLHPYGRKFPNPNEVRKVRPSALKRFHSDRVRPRRSILVVVGDIQPAAALEKIERALRRWRAPAPAPGPPALEPPRTGPTVLADRPGSVQSNIRIGGPALPRNHPDFYPLLVANTIYGGYFSSRMVENLRERKGYSYTPRSHLDHKDAISTLNISADVRQDATAPALHEIRYELSRMVTSKVEEAELTSAKRYLSGTSALSIQTQSGLAAQLATIYAAGLDISYLGKFQRNVETVSLEEVQEAAARYLSPKNLVTVVVGDASAIRSPLETLDNVETPAKG